MFSYIYIQARRGGGGVRPPPFLTPPLNQKFSATPKICLKLCSSSKIVDFTTFFLKFLINFWISILKWPKTEEFWFFWGGLVHLVLFNIGSNDFRPPPFFGASVGPGYCNTIVPYTKRNYVSLNCLLKTRVCPLIFSKLD